MNIKEKNNDEIHMKPHHHHRECEKIMDYNDQKSNI